MNMSQPYMEGNGEYLKEKINDRMEGITFGYNRRSKVFRSIFVQYGVAMQYGWY